jgi:hypothetical protein
VTAHGIGMAIHQLHYPPIDDRQTDRQHQQLLLPAAAVKHSTVRTHNQREWVRLQLGG